MLIYNIANLLRSGAKKFRENNADSTLFNLAGHTALLPRTSVVTRELPKPRKGNLGTNKTYFNIRIMRDISADGESPKLVPQILKLETSNPVGITETDLTEIFSELNAIISSRTGDKKTYQNSVFLEGALVEILPQVEDTV